MKLNDFRELIENTTDASDLASDCLLAMFSTIDERNSDNNLSPAVLSKTLRILSDRVFELSDKADALLAADDEGAPLQTADDDDDEDDASNEKYTPVDQLDINDSVEAVKGKHRGKSGKFVGRANTGKLRVQWADGSVTRFPADTEKLLKVQEYTDADDIGEEDVVIAVGGKHKGKTGTVVSFNNDKIRVKWDGGQAVTRFPHNTKKLLVID